MNIWNKISKFVVVLLLGIITGIVAAVKWIAPPGDDIVFGKIKVKGKGNNQATEIEIDKNAKSKKQLRQEKRKAKKLGV